jgi:hypothetical protein
VVQQGPPGGDGLPHETGWLREALATAEARLGEEQRANGTLTRTVKVRRRAARGKPVSQAVSQSSSQPMGARACVCRAGARPRPRRLRGARGGGLQGLERELAELREGHAMRNSTAASPGPRVSSSSLNWLLGGGGGGGGGGASSSPPAPSSASSAAGDDREAGVAVGGKSFASHRALDDLSKR